ncbi:ATP-binding cassette sub- B member 5, partial [Thoreauomyces humboldtii]
MIDWLKALFGRPAAQAKDADDHDDDDDEEPSVRLWALFRFASALDRLAVAMAVLCSILNSTSSFAWVYILVRVSDTMSELVTHPKDGSPARADAETKFQHDIVVFVGLFVSEKQGLLIRRATYGAILRKDIAWHDGNPAGETIALITSHVDAVHGISDNLGQLVQGLAGFAIGIVFSLVVAWRLALPLVACMSVLMISSTKFYDLVSSRVRTIQGAAKGAAGIASEVLGAIRTVKAFGAEKFETRRYAAKLAIVREAAITGFKLSGLEIGFTSFYFNACYAFGIWYAYRLHVSGSVHLDGTDALQALLLLLLGAETLADTLGFLDDVQGACVAGATIFEMIDTATIHDEASDGIKVPIFRVK